LLFPFFTILAVGSNNPTRKAAARGTKDRTTAKRGGTEGAVS